MLEVLLLILGLAGLWLGAELVIKGSLRLSRYYKLSRAFVGLVILSIGTNLPELFIHVTGGAHRLLGVLNSNLIIGETIGTSIGQISLAVGLAGLFGALSITKKQLNRDGLMMLLATVLLLVVSLNGEITRVEGVFLGIIFFAYMFYLFKKERFQEKIDKPVNKKVLWTLTSLIVGLFILILSSELTVSNALILSKNFGVEQSLVGILIVGVGTSLPEIVTSISAVKKKVGSLAVGNLIGSNILDLLLTPSIGAFIAPLIVSGVLLFDMVFLFLISGVVLFFFKSGRKIERKESIAILIIYFSYFGIKIITSS
ncbi:MAG: sodium:calcium antiporter [Nanoarchaeota archaeon]|nr:sodium:calcium antiporter [Nanoarchaeota archaeon]